MSEQKLSVEESMEVLQRIVDSYDVGSEEHFSLSRAVEALAFSWRQGVRTQFQEFVKNFNGDLSEAELDAFRERGWIDN